ncbi:MAG: hypothetical protein OYH77_01430, partial [Pseudomonadota bacterium]|nr:hypothetical protein [Pseudomonadota bacterium]
MKYLLTLPLLLGIATCKFNNFSDFSSFRTDAKGNHVALIGLFMNDTATVMSGEFFPFELYNEKHALADEQGTFKGFAADIVTNKDPLGGFRDREGIDAARKVSSNDPHYFGGYYLKIMIVHDDYHHQPQHVQLLRGYFPDDFTCPKGRETVRFSADDNAIDPPSTDKLLGRKARQDRIYRTVNFCKAKETNGKYKGKTFYYTRVALFDESTSYTNELYDERSAYEKLYTSVMQAHEMIVAAVKLATKSNQSDVRLVSVLGLTYEVQPPTQEMLDKLSINTVHDYGFIVETTDAVQKYIFANKHRQHDANWQTLLLAQRKWLAIRLILKNLPTQTQDKAEHARQLILNALEVADFRDAMPLALNLTHYAKASDYLKALANNPSQTVEKGEAKEQYFTKTTNINSIAFDLAFASLVRQWAISTLLYNWIPRETTVVVLCKLQKRCPDELIAAFDKIVEDVISQKYEELKSLDRHQLHSIITAYIEAVNKIYPDPRTAAAAFKGKWIFSDTIDYDNSSDEFKMAYQRYSQRYDMIFSEPHGALLATKAFIDAMGKKRTPADLPISNSATGLTYDWKMHNNVQISVLDNALQEMHEGFNRQLLDLIGMHNKIANKSNADEMLLEFFDFHHTIPIAKALLVRPDLAHQVAAVLPRAARKTVAEHVESVLVYASIATTVAAMIVASKFANFPHSKIMGTALFASGVAADVSSTLARYYRQRTEDRRLDGALFADLFGNDMQEYMQVRKQLGALKRDLYIGLGLSSVDFVGMVKGLRMLHASNKAIEALGKFGKVPPGVANAMRDCSTPYCRNFVQGLTFLQDNKAAL